MSIITVDFKVYSSKWHITKVLSELFSINVLSFDTEVEGVYSKKERKKAEEYLEGKNLDLSTKRIALQIASNNGLSFPSLVNVTHFIFGTSENCSTIILCRTPAIEKFIWNWIAEYKGLLLIHNTLFDLKLMYDRIGKFPQNYEDTALLAKCLTNNVQTWKSRVGLKELMGEYYDPMWSLFNQYEPENIKDPKFLTYASIDGAATYKLWFDIKDYMVENNE